MKSLMNRDISWITFQHRVLDQAKWRGTHDALVFLGISASNTEEFLSVRYPKFISQSNRKSIKLMVEGIGAYYRRYSKLLKDKDVVMHSLSKSDAKTLRAVYDKKYSELKFKPAKKCTIVPNTMYCLVNGKYLIKIPNSMRFVEFKKKKLILAEDLIKHFNKDIKTCSTFSVCMDEDSNAVTAVDINSSSKDDFQFIMNIVNVTKTTVVHVTDFVKSSCLKSLSKDFRGGSKIEYKGVNSFTKKSSFDYIKKADRLVFHPYESYDKSVVKFIKDSANDKHVIHIRILLYRITPESKILEALMDAAKNGKKVDVVVELKVRFDEENNKHVAKELRKHGVNVIYTPANIKTHAKACLVIRREKGEKQYYTHICTGNYNERNARQYTDYSFFTADNDIGKDIDKFISMVGGDKVFVPKTLIYSPYNLRDALSDMIDEAIASKSKGNKVELIFKTNSISDKKIAQKLIKASEKGVKVCGIVRSSSVIGSEKNLNVISIVGDLLEHSRAYCLVVDGIPKRIYIGSSDIMPRNMDRRNEILIQISDKKLMKKIYSHMEIYYGDKNSYTILNSYRIKRRKKCHSNSCFKAFQHEFEK